MRSKNYLEFILSLLALVSLLVLRGPIAQGSEDPCLNKETSYQQVSHYCSAAKTADAARKGQKAVAAIQGIVSGVCLASCAGSWTGISEGICNGVAIGGIAASLAAGKEAAEKFQTLLSGIMPAGTMIASGSVGAAFTAGTSSINGSCLTAAIAGVTSYMAFEGAARSKEAAQKNRELARSLSSTHTPLLNLSKTDAIRLSGSTGIRGSSGGAPTPRGSETGLKSTQPELLRNLSNSCSTPGFSGTLNCALAQPDNSIPDFVSDPEFRKMVEKMSGRSLDDLTAIEDPTELIQGTLGETLKDQQRSLVETLKATQVAALAEVGGVNRLTSKNQTSLLEFGHLESQKRLAQNEELSFGKNSPTEAGSKLGDENNPAMSIFSRVSKRYATSSHALIAESYAHLQALVFKGGK